MCVLAYNAEASDNSVYLYEGPGFVSGTGPTDFNLNIGGGAEASLKNGFGVGADVGYTFLNNTKGFGSFSPGVVYKFQPSKKLVPFIDGGYALLFRDDTLNAVYFGGGVNYFISKNVGLRLEVRDNIATDKPENFNLMQFKVGVLFR
jgi:hypothetical protein